jgi:ABC-type polysaccharide/polyol phosphate transport system ATPase subunit
MGEAVVRADGVWKRFRLYHERNQSLKATVMRRGRATYEDFWALEDVSFEVFPGSTFGLIGHNGSGKSTMLKTLSKILRPDKGSVAVEGKMSALLELGAGFHPELSGRENIYLNGAILGLTKRELDRKFDDIVGFAGLERFIDSPVKNYSSGMYVRLGFSVAINVDPDVLLIDEVLAVGDEEFQRKCLERVADLRAAGKTIVVVTHSLMTVRSLCDQALWLENGMVREIGTGNDVADAYLGEVQVEMQAEEEAKPESRWSQLRLTDVELLDDRGRPTTRVATGDAVTFRLRYETTEPVLDPIFSFALSTPEGVLVTGPNTKEADVRVDKVEGEGTVELRVDRLLLLHGSYDITVDCTNRSVTHSYDRRAKMLRFDVTPGVPHETYGGLVSLDGRYKIDSQ